jgi:hypothetical protein
MRRFRHRGAVLVACAIAATSAGAQLNLPRIVQLPEDDFVYTWGDNVSVDDRTRPHFTIKGIERSFRCTLTGAFRPGSRMRDYYNQRSFEQELVQSIEFIQLGVARLNELYLSNNLDWAVMDCAKPRTEESEDEVQERLDRAVERAERERERRRAREERSEDE